MKKTRFLSYILCLALLLQMAVVPAAATETTTAVTAAPTVEETLPYVEPPKVAYGGASITNGCRTINGMTPMAGSDRMLETCQAAFAYETTTETIIYSYNPDNRLYPGSLAKMVTALIAIEEGDLNEVISFSTQWNSSLPLRAIVADLKEGEEITMEALVYWTLLASANDAAMNIAGHIAGSQDAFVEMMNQRVVEMGCTDTHFTNAHGLDDPDQYTTARDMAKIVLAATQNDVFRKAFGSKGFEVPPTNRTEKEFMIETDNHLIYTFYLPQFGVSSVTGGKTSSTAGAGSSIVCTAEKNGMSMIYVVLGAVRTYDAKGKADYYGNFEEVIDLMEYCSSKYKIARVIYPDMILNQFPVIGGECEVSVQPDIAVNSVVPVDCRLDNLIFRYDTKGLTAPIEEGQNLGTVQVWYRTSCVTESEIFAVNPVRSTVNSGVHIQSAASRDDSNILDFLLIIGVVILGIFALFGIYVAINSARRAAAINRRRRRRASRRRSR